MKKIKNETMASSEEIMKSLIDGLPALAKALGKEYPFKDKDI